MTSEEEGRSRMRWMVGTAIAVIAGIVVPLYLALRDDRGDRSVAAVPSSPGQSATTPITKAPESPAPTSSSPRVSGTVIHSGVLYTKCVTAASPRLADSTAVVIDDCEPGSPTQQWLINADGTITSATKPAMCLDVTGGHLGQGAGVVLSQCTGLPASGTSQRWSFQPGGPIRSASGNWCLDDPFGDVSNGIRLEIVECDASGKPWPPQQWFPS